MQIHPSLATSKSKANFTEAEHIMLCASQDSEMSFCEAMSNLKKDFSIQDITLILQEACIAIDYTKPEMSDFDVPFLIDDDECRWICEMFRALGIGHQNPCSFIANFSQHNVAFAFPGVFVDKETIDKILVHIECKIPRVSSNDELA